MWDSPLYYWVHPDDIERYDKNDRYYEENPAPYSIEYRIRNLDGNFRHVVETCEPEFDHVGRVIRWVGVCQDVTERVRRENERAAAMKRAYEASEVANEAKSRFISSMSHEFRTPLNAILGFSQILNMEGSEPLSEKQRQFVETIHASGAHLVALLDQILDLSQIENGNVQITLEDCEPDSLIASCVAMSRANAARHGVDIINEPPPSHLPSVRADSARFRQVMINLISNAIKYNRPHGEVRVSAAEDDGVIRVSVADTGIGIARDRQNEVFEPFNRIGREVSNVEGTGIGLTIAKQFVELMGGRIGFQSELGEGSEFWVEMPVA